MKEEHGEGKISLLMVVSGSPYTLEFAGGQKIRVVVEQTLTETNNIGQPVENWELRDTSGTLLDMDKHLKEYQFEDGTQLFLNPKAGIGG